MSERVEISETSTQWQRVFGGWNRSCLAAQNVESSRSVESEVKSFFSSLRVSESSPQLQEEAIALLIKSLEDALTSKHLQSRICAIGCLKGALQTQQQQDETPPMLSSPVMKLLGNFVLQQCGPILVEESTEDSDLDEQVRDSAVQTIAALLHTMTDTTNNESFEESILYRLHLSQETVKLRCAIPDDEDDELGKYSQDQGQIAPRGLASLPRLRRSLCFELLRSTLDGLKPLLVLTLSSRISSPLLQWVEFSIHCLYGESDPRCLIQLLNFLADLQKACLDPLCSQFPVATLFDAVSSYYPIQFTPPPQMSHTVTREDLTRALWNILSCTIYDNAQNGHDTMFALTLGLILDQLVPLPEDGPATLDELRDALEDLKSLLRITKYGSSSAVDVAALFQGSIEPSALLQVASALRTVHAQTAVPGASGSPIAQQVSVICRDLIADIALSCELQTKEPRFWKLFVNDVTLDVVRGQPASSLPRSDIVYLACLAGCGGVKTMKFVLDQTLPAFLQIIGAFVVSSEDDNTVSEAVNPIHNALNGAAALLASVQGTLKRQPAGVVINPHPMEFHGSSTIDSLSQAWKQLGDVERMGSDRNRSRYAAVRLALVRTMETALMVLPKTVDTTHLDQILRYLSDLSEKAMLDDIDLGNHEKQFLAACSRSLGIAVGEAMNGAQALKNDFSVLQSSSIRHELTTTIFPFLLKKASARNCQTALAVACSMSEPTSQAVVEEFMSTVVASIRNQDDYEKIIADVADVLSSGGRNASAAFQSSDFLFQVRSALLPACHNNNGEINLGVSSLQLPIPAEEAAREQAEIERLVNLLEPLHSIYDAHANPSHLTNLVAATCKVVPPLDSNDMKHFAILLPFLSAALETLETVADLDKPNVMDLITYLPELVLSDVSPAVRYYGINCLHSLLAKDFGSDQTGCPCMDILETHVMAAIHKLLQGINEASSQKQMKFDKLSNDIKALGEAISFTGCIGSAAIQRSGQSFSTADRVVGYLVDMACCGKAETVSSKPSNDVFILISDELFPGATTFATVAALSAFGAILSSGPRNALWKQRLSFIAWKHVQSAVRVSTPISIGVLGTSAYIICSCGWKSMPPSMSTALSDNILQGLSLECHVPATIKKVMLAAVVKLVSLRYDPVEKNVLGVVTGVLRAYATADGDERSLSCKMLALQALDSIPSVLTSQGSIAAVKPAVISILEQAMVDKSSILRHAAVEVRNSWYLV